MLKQVKFTVKIQCKVEQRTYNMLNSDPSKSSSLNTETFPALAIVDHHIDYALKTVFGQLDEFTIEPESIRRQTSAILNDVTTLHEITCELPVIYVLDKQVYLLGHALDAAIKRVAEHVYVDGDYTVLDAIQLALENEINEVFTKFLRQRVEVVRATQVSSSGWVSVRLLSTSEDSLLAFWLPKNVVCL